MSQHLHLNVSVTSKEAAGRAARGQLHLVCPACLPVNTRGKYVWITMFFLLGGPSVQKQSIPALLEGRDALVRSQTGSGQPSFNFCPPSQNAQPQSWPRLYRKVSARGNGCFVLFGEGEMMLSIRALD